MPLVLSILLFFLTPMIEIAPHQCFCWKLGVIESNPSYKHIFKVNPELEMKFSNSPGIELVNYMWLKSNNRVSNQVPSFIWFLTKQLLAKPKVKNSVLFSLMNLTLNCCLVFLMPGFACCVSLCVSIFFTYGLNYVILFTPRSKVSVYYSTTSDILLLFLNTDGRDSPSPVSLLEIESGWERAAGWNHTCKHIFKVNREIEMQLLEIMRNWYKSHLQTWHRKYPTICNVFNFHGWDEH